MGGVFKCDLCGCESLDPGHESTPFQPWMHDRYNDYDLCAVCAKGWDGSLIRPATQKEYEQKETKRLEKAGKWSAL